MVWEFDKDASWASPFSGWESTRKAGGEAEERETLVASSLPGCKHNP